MKRIKAYLGQVLYTCGACNHGRVAAAWVRVERCRCGAKLEDKHRQSF